MKNEFGNFEDLLKETFDGFEADAPANAWANIQSGIKPVATAGKGTGSKGVIKFLAAAAVVGGVAGGYFIFNSNTKDTVADNKELTTIESHQTQGQQTQVETNSPATTVSENTKDNSVSPGTSQEVNNTPENNSVQDKTTETNNIPVQKDVYKNEPVVERTESRTPENKNTEPDAANNYQPANANINVDKLTGDVPLVINFSNGGSGVTYEWDFGDGKETTKYPSPRRTFDEVGEYRVTLTVKDTKGRVSTDYIIVKATAKTSVQIPNIITPNNDGFNDRFEVKLESVKTIEGTILDKTGKVIYQWYMPNDSWDGRLSDGSDAPAGDYFYTVKYINSEDKTELKRGTVKLTR